MASLNTLRTKFGIVLSIVIGLALLAFVLSLKTEMGFSGENPTVAKIDGKKIKYSDYLEVYDRVKMQYGESAESNPQQADMLYNTAWQMLLSDIVLEPGFDKLGLAVGESERMDLISGRQPSQTMMNAFADRRTGVYDIAAVTEFLAQADANPQVSRMWGLINEEMLFERSIGKYLGLIKGGVYVNSLEAEQGATAANRTYSGRWAGAKYESVPDSLFTVSSSEIRSFYNDHKAMFRQMPSRTISYVVFDVAATDGDMMALTEQAKSVAAEFAAAAEVRPFVRANRNGRVADRYMTAAQLSEAEAEALTSGKMFGPELKNNIWTMSRVVDVKVAPDTLGIRHIVLPFSEEKLADSLLTALRAGGDFAQAARQHSVYEATAVEGGDTGLTPFTTFTGEFANALAGVKSGDIVKIATGDAIQIMQIYRAGKPTRHMQIATIEYPVEASAETRRTIHNNAGTFAMNAGGSVEKFNEAVAIAAVTPRVGTIAQGERQLRGLEDSREVVRWAEAAKVGDVSEIFNVEGNYVIAVLTGIDNEKFQPLKRAEKQIETEILKGKKYDHIVRNISGTTFEEMTQGLRNSGSFSDVTYPMFFVQGMGVEPRVVGAIASTAEGAISAPVKGKTGVYMVQVEQVATDEKQTPEGEKVRAQAANEGMIQQRALQAIQQMSDMEDLRGKYF